MKLAFQVFVGSVVGLVSFGVALFVPAGTFDYWQAWVFLAVFAVATGGPNVYLAVTNPAALQRRMNAGPIAETRPAQRIVICAVIVSAYALPVISALDHRFGWSSVPLAVVVLGDVMVAAGLLVAELVVIQNGYASANITVEKDQPLVSTGLYGLVRHPMYLGALIMMLGTPLALDSLWGLLVVIPALAVFLVRISDEERLLRQELDGYDDYANQVRYRLVPAVW